MTNFDVEYLKLCKKILNEGVEVENRTGINTIKIPSYNFEFDLRKEFPILETKRTYFKNAIIEMLWIWQMGSNNVQDLHDRDVHIWDEWRIDDDGIYRIYEPEIQGKEYVYVPDKEVIVLDPLSVPITDPYAKRHTMKPKLDENNNIMKAKSLLPGKTIKMAKYYGKELAGTIGKVYGFTTGRYEYPQDLIYTAKNIPTDRRMNYDLGQREFLREAVLPPCVYGTEWDVTDGKLSLLVHQRSCDVPLGLPFNITQYATLLKMMAQVTGLEPTTVSYSIKDAHIYVNQIEGIKEQLRREKRYYELLKYSKQYLYEYKNSLEKMLPFLDKDSKEYQELDTEIRTIDIIINPTKPNIELDKSIDDFFAFDNSKELKHTKVKEYKHMGKIDIPRAQ